MTSTRLAIALGFLGAFAVAILVLHSRVQTNAPTTTNSVEEKPNLLLITIDTLRPDHLGAYGYASIQTPAIDRIARSGVLFKNAVCQTPLTLVSHTSIFTGLNPNIHGVRDNAYSNLSGRYKTLAQYLEQRGYGTAAFIGSAVLDRRFGLANGFSSYSRYQPTSVFGMESERKAEEVVNEALSWMQKSDLSKPHFIWIHLYDPHSPYRPPEPFRARYASNPYDGEIAYTDHVLDAFWQEAEGLGFFRNTVTVVMGDHGESLGEHEEDDHGFYIYDATLRIPLIISWPGHVQPRVVEEQVQSIDVLPTLAELIGFHPDGTVQGVSMLPLMKGEHEQRPPAYGEVFTSKLYYGWSELKSVRSNDWKLIEAPKPELYDLRRDPHEQKNVVADHPDRLRLLREQLKKFVALEHGTESNSTNTLDAERLEQLASLGYIGASGPAGILNHTSNIDPKDRIQDYLTLHRMLPQAIERIDQSEFDEALSLLQQAEKRFPDSFVLRWYSGFCYAKTGNLQEARRSYSDAMRLNPFFSRAYTDLALTLELLDRHDEAIKLLDTAPPSALTVAEREITRGEIQMHHSDTQAAEAAYESVKKSDPQNPEAEYGLARIYLATGRIENAVSAMETLAAADYPSEDVYYSLFAIYSKEGARDSAQKVAQQWSRLFPQSVKAREALEKLK